MVSIPGVRKAEPLQGVVRAFDILEAFTLDTPELSTVELARTLGLPKGTVSRFLATMTARGYTEQDPVTRRYRLGMRVLDLSRVLLGQLDVRRRALSWLERLSRETGENVNLAVRSGAEMVYLDRIEGRQFLNMNLRVGSRLPLHCSSMGKVLLAFLPLAQQEAVLTQMQFERFTPNTIVDPATFRAELVRTAERGWAINNEELAAGLITVAAPVFGYSGDVVAAMNVSGPASRMTPQALRDVVIPALVRCAAAASRAMGAPPNRLNGEAVRPADETVWQPDAE